MLSEPIRQRIVEKYEQLNRDGQLLSQQQLDQYYATFRQKFGPQALSQLDGVVLLETMHGTAGTGNRDDLAYWLEFKNDEEFPTPSFGGIAGGYAAKFGVYRRKETGTWAKVGAGHNPQDISVDEAVAIARTKCHARDEVSSSGRLYFSRPNATWRYFPRNGS